MKEGTSAVLLQSALDEKWWADSMECCCYLRNVQDSLADGKTPNERRFAEPFQGPTIPSGAIVECYPISTKDQSRLHKLGKKVLPGIFLGYALITGEFGDELFCFVMWKNWTHGSIRDLPERSQCKRSSDLTEGRRICLPNCSWDSEIVSERLRIPRNHSKAGTVP